ncbi:MAG TPA: serine/threonine-protein kinase, partial [Minicystis sp.]|nr:serine/threonine-protein kinase [Minicystis sp.]
MSGAAAVAELQPGHLFAERYAIEELIGRGGMGAVYRVRDFALGEPIALKVLLTDDTEPTPAALVRFRQEVRLARRVTHPNVARVYDLGEHAGVLFLTMELVEGGTLRTLLHGGRRLPLRRALGIARSIADGLAAAHAVGVVHRDLKPGNVLLDTRGRVVLTDFGVARAMSDELSLTVGAIGTPSYMAPEQAANAGVDPRTDLYALGLVIAEMLTGELPRGGAPAAERAVAGSGAPAALASLVGRCLAVNPHERPGDAAAVAQVLAAAIDALDHDGDTETERAAAISNASPGPKSGVGVQPPVPTGPVTGVRATAFDMAETAVVGARRADDGSCAPAPPPFDRALAVLPFRFRGPADQAYLGDALGDELVDQLSRTRGLRVFASGATSRFRDDRDPRLVGRELGADVVIDGVAARDGDTLRITTRLLDGKSGVQLWSDRVDVRFSDALGVAESIARRVAEELRVEITLLSRNGRAPDEVVSTYFAARRRLRVPDASAIQEAIEGFSRCIDLAPSFAPAYAGLAMVSLRRWFVFEDRDRTLQAAAEDAIECASAHAPELAET